MLAVKNRLRRQKDFQQVAAKGKKYFSDFFMIKVLPKSEGEIKIGIVVSNKVSKKAVVRNRLKRWISADLYQYLDKLPLADYLILVKPPIADKSHEDITNNLFNILKKIIKTINVGRGQKRFG